MSLLETILSDPAFIAGLFTVLGGISLKIVEKWLARGQVVSNERQGLREEIKDLNVQLDKEEEDVSSWRRRFFESEEQNHKLRMTMIEKGWEELEKRPEN